MRFTPLISTHGKATILCAALLIASCSKGNGSRSTVGDSSADQPFVIEGISVVESAQWQINRPIDITFNHRINAATVNANTINIADASGLGAMGDYEVNGKTVRFQPACPTLEDFSDAGLRPSTDYTLHILGSTSGGVTVRDTDGNVLEEGRVVNFSTPDSTDPLALFLDTVPGPPSVVLRPQGNIEEDFPGVRLEIESTGEVQYFELNAAQQGSIPGGYLTPLNKYSDIDSRFSILVFFDQPVSSSSTNVSSSRIVIEYRDVGGDWNEIGTDVVLESNCISDTRVQVGASVRLTPRGVLPQGLELRVNLKQGFADITGDQTSADTANFANMDTDLGVPGPDLDSDELLETFLTSELEDTSAALAVPPALWGDGKLQAQFDFAGTGGPDGEFDWYIDPGSTLILNTTADTILGGPGGAVTGSQTVINGVVNIRDLLIPESSKLIIVGPNICTILASGKVQILGELSVRGSDNPGVGTLNTTNLPEAGASGQAGGGTGGVGSYLTSQSTPRGGNGFGAFEVPNQGGQGGEASYHPTSKNDRRGAGGGGGGFGPDVIYDFLGDIVRCQSLIGMDGEAGRGGGLNGTGAVSQTARAQGGELGPDPFFDAADDNNFFGSILTPSGELIIGELTQVWGGGGGGAGGDAIRSDSFPLVPFTIGGDEKGSGGGGGAGGLRILAVGEIVVGPTARVAADGGRGGGGENTSFFDRVGGGSGAGAGGHIVLSSAAFIQMDAAVLDGSSVPVEWYLDSETSASHVVRSVSALGGQGGAGRDNKGGANETGNTLWRCDAIPVSHFEGIPDVPPSNQTCYTNLPDLTDPLGPVLGAGGDGSPGLIQLHVDAPALNLRFPAIQVLQTPPTPPYGGGLDVTPAMVPPPIGWSSPTDLTNDLVPFFGKLSVSRSKWIPLGLARLGVDGAGLPLTSQVLFDFLGVDVDGVIERIPGSELVMPLPPIVPPGLIGDPGAPLLDSPFTIVFDAGDPSNDIYRGNSNLLRRFTVKLENAANAMIFQRFTVESATYLPVLDRFECTVAPTEDTMQDFVDQVGAASTLASLEPRYFRMETNELGDAYPSNSAVRILWDATVADIEGDPSESMSYSELLNMGQFAPLIGDLNADVWDFFRFQAEFDINVSGMEPLDATTPRPALLFMRVPFQF